MPNPPSIHSPHRRATPPGANVATLLAVVAETHLQRRVGLRLLNHEGWQPIGHVTIPPNQPVPPVGAVIEVRYRNTSRDGSLSQPVYRGERRDVAVEECGVSQLKCPRDPAG